MDKYRFGSSSSLDLGHLFYHIHNSLQVGAPTIWCPAGDVELSHLVCLLRLRQKNFGERYIPVMANVNTPCYGRH